MRTVVWTVSWGSSVGSKDMAGNVIEEPVDAGHLVVPYDGTVARDAPVLAVGGAQLQDLLNSLTGQCSTQLLPVGKDEEVCSRQARF